MDKKLLAKKAVLSSLKKEMDAMMGEGRGDLKDLLGKKKLMKVEVASDSPEGLKKGLSKAEEIMSKRNPASEEKMDKSSESSEYSCPECEDLGCEACEAEMENSEESESEESPEELKAKIAELQKQLSSKE